MTGVLGQIWGWGVEMVMLSIQANKPSRLAAWTMLTSLLGSQQSLPFTDE